MRYFIAILHTVLLVLIPLIMIPALQWYKRTLSLQSIDLLVVYILLVLINLGMLIMTVIRWVIALKNDRDLL